MRQNIEHHAEVERLPAKEQEDKTKKLALVEKQRAVEQKRKEEENKRQQKFLENETKRKEK